MQRDVAPEGPDATRGLGWGIRRVLGVKRVAHSGGMPGVSTFLALYPEDQIVVAVLLNKSVGRATDAVTTELTAAVIPRFAAALRAQRAAPQPAVRPAIDTTGLRRLTGEWRGFIHTYVDSVPAVLTLAGRDSSHLRVGSASVALENVWLEHGVLTARAPLQLNAPDLARQPHALSLWLRVSDGKLSGYAAAQTTTGRAYYALSSYMALVQSR
jgi:hypothetical protein